MTTTPPSKMARPAKTLPGLFGRFLRKTGRRLSQIALASAFCCSLLALDAPAQPNPLPGAAERAVADETALEPAELKALPGVKVEAIAEGSIEGQVVAMAFADDGTPHILEWTRGGELRNVAEEQVPDGPTNAGSYKTVKEARDYLKTLHDRDGDGVYDEVRVLMDDLELPSGLLLHDGWIYWTSGGLLRRRRPHEAELLAKLQAAAEAKTGPPTKATADGRWIEQRLVRGLAAMVPFQVRGLALAPDGLLYVTCGSGKSAAQGWDGSQAAVVRSGAVFRMRPDGSQVEEFARGLARPAGPLAFGPQGEALLADADWVEDRLANLRLIHVLERGDFGWFHARPRASDADAVAQAASQPDPRVSATGERLGTLPPIAQKEGGQPQGLLWCRGTRFPAALRDAVLVGDPERGRLLAWRVTGDAGLLRAIEPVAMLQGEAGAFQPQHVVQGPDGAIYVASSGQDLPSRIYRLSWSGTDEAPAIELAPLDSWKGIAQANDEALFSLLIGDDGELRSRAAGELVARARRDMAAAAAIRQGLIDVALNAARPEAARVTAHLATTQLADEATREAWGKLLASEVASFRRLGLEALGNHPPEIMGLIQQQAETVQYAVGSERDPLTKRAGHLALGKLAAAGSTTAAEWGFEATSVTFGPGLSPYVFDGHVRGLELAPGAAKELMLGNLFVAIDFDVTEFDERQRIKSFVVATAEAMRTRELADFLDALLRGEEDYLAKMEAPLEARLIAAYQNVHTIPPIHADAVAEWIEKHPGGPAEVELAALETLSLVGTTKPAVKEQLAASLLEKPDTAKQVATSLLAGRIDRALAPQVAAALRQHAAQDATGEIANLQGQIKRQFPNP